MVKSSSLWRLRLQYLVVLLKKQAKLNLDMVIGYIEDHLHSIKFFNVWKFLNHIKNINNTYDIIIISSFEYIEKIKKNINMRFKNTQIFSIYDNCSRSIMDTYLIKKNGSRKKIYENGIYQKL